MDRMDLYRDIAQRTQGDIYIGVVGPVRTGKSTFIKRFLDLLILPGIENPYEKERLVDELPQSGSGKTIMTTQPKFVPNEALKLELDETTSINVRLVDCVGYMVPGAIGHTENDVPRMVRTPWFDYDIPFEDAAEIGTRKVMTDHSTIGVVMTTDGSITQIPRSAYIEAEDRVISELKTLGKPFVIVLNSVHPEAAETQNLRDALQIKHGGTVVCADVMNMSAVDASALLEQALMEFPIRMLHLNLPSWMQALDSDHWLIKRLTQPLTEALPNVGKMRDYSNVVDMFQNIEGFIPAKLEKVELGNGNVQIDINPVENMFYMILGEECGCEIKDDFHLITMMKDFVGAKHEYDRISDALNSMRSNGYGIVPPNMDEMELMEPEIVQQGNRFGVRLKARASGIHMIRVDIDSEVAPLVGTEEQSEEFAAYLMDTFENNPAQIWDTNIFGKPLYDLVREGMNNKISRMPDNVQNKLQNTLQKIVNHGCNSLICIML